MGYGNEEKVTLLRFISLIGRNVMWVEAITYLLTYLLTPLSNVLLEKLTGFQLVKKFPAFYGTPRSITLFTNAGHLSLS